jgi:hypothetical protein
VTLERRIAAAFRMDDATWARHANPWSGWTRLTALPLLALAGWSRAWIGGWWLLALAAALAWTWLNPRLFPPPARMDAWMTRGVLGERIWLARDTTPVPAHHRLVPNILSVIAGAGVLLAAWGVVILSAWPTITGIVVAMLAKLWFLDRMAWLHADGAKGPGSP